MKILKIIVGIILLGLGLQGLYAEATNDSFEVIAGIFNLALALLGGALIFETLRKK